MLGIGENGFQGLVAPPRIDVVAELFMVGPVLDNMALGNVRMPKDRRAYKCAVA